MYSCVSFFPPHIYIYTLYFFFSFYFTGSYLLSGGEEAVLVMWQFDTKNMSFLPRLGSEILTISISPDQTLYAIGFLDNSIKIYSVINLEMKQSMQGLKYGAHVYMYMHVFVS